MDDGLVVAVSAIWLLRHGSTPSSEAGRFLGWTDEGLSRAGRAEALELRRRVAATGAKTVWSSDLRRALETSRLVAGEPTADARLRELDFGDLEGLTWQQCSPAQRAALTRFDGFRAPSGESVEELGKRVHAFLEELPAGQHLLVTHGGVIRLLLREIGDPRGVPPCGLVQLG